MRERKNDIIRFIFKGADKAIRGGKISYRRISRALAIIRNAMAGERARKRAEKASGCGIPPFCIFSVTWLCNLACSGCYAKNYERKDLLSPENISSIIRKLISYGTNIFIIAGGEPLIVPGLPEMLGEMKKGVFFLFTNGTLIDDEKIRLFRKYNNIMPILSIEGDNAFTDHRRGSGVSDKLDHVIEMFNKNDIPFGFSSMATHRNIERITSFDYLDSMVQRGAVFSFIIDYIPFPFSIDKELILTSDDNRIKKAELAKRADDIDMLVFNFPSDEYSDGFCESAGKSFIHINANGNVEPCPFSHYAVDNILKSDYIDILNSGFFRQIREKFHTVEHYGQCLLFQYDSEVAKIAEETNAYKTERGD